jgi:hypothetical protein
VARTGATISRRGGDRAKRSPERRARVDHHRRRARVPTCAGARARLTSATPCGSRGGGDGSSCGERVRVARALGAGPCRVRGLVPTRTGRSVAQRRRWGISPTPYSLSRGPAAKCRRMVRRPRGPREGPALVGARACARARSTVGFPGPGRRVRRLAEAVLLSRVSCETRVRRRPRATGKRR